MRVLITGGTGLIGRALSANLVTDDHEVIILSRTPRKASGLPADVVVQQWDAKTASGWGHLADGADAIVNLAGENIGAGRWTDERKARIENSRLNAGRAVVEAVEQASQKPKVVIQASGVGYYGPRGDEKLTEDASPGDDWAAQVVVRYWEASTEPVETMGVRRAIIRSAPVLDADDGALPRMVLATKLFVGGPLGDGQQWFSWIHLQDEVAAIRFLIENPEAHGPFNLSAPNPVTNAQFMRALGRVLGRPAIMPTPAFAVKLVFGEMATVVLDGQRAIPKHLQQLGFEFQYLIVEAALKDVLA
ncbi:MAG: TIGR01777 family oxidoreductase [Anaerolineae bacterium]|jgi:hypothetical protein